MATPKKPTIRAALAVASAALLLSGCASYVGAKQEVARAPEAIRAAEMRRDAEVQRNSDLRTQQAEAERSRAALSADIKRSETELVKLEARIKSAKSTTAAQRQEMQRLVKMQKSLEQEMAALEKEPPPTTAGDMGARQLQLESLRLEKEKLQKQVAALQSAL